MRAFLRSNARSCLRTQKVVCLADCSNSPPSVLAERRFVFTWSGCHRSAPCSGERKSRFGNKEFPTIFDPLPRGLQDTCGVLPQPSLAACVRRRQPWQEAIFLCGIVLTQTISQGNRWLNWQELLPRDFGTNQGLKSVDILCVFQRFQAAELGQKIRHQPKVI